MIIKRKFRYPNNNHKVNTINKNTNYYRQEKIIMNV